MADHTPGFVNAKVLFSHEKSAPTYALEIGEAASSEPFAIARRASLEKSILDRATEILGGAFHDMQQKKARLGLMEERLAADQKLLDDRRTEVDDVRSKLQEERDQLRTRSAQYIKTSAARTLAQIDEALREAKSLARDLQTNPNADGARVAQKRLVELSDAVQSLENTESAPERGGLPEPGSESTPVFEAGDQVAVGNEKKTGRILQVSKGRAEVELGSLRLWLPLSKLRPAPTVVDPSPPMARRQRVKIERSDEEPATALEIDIRGLRVDEAIGEVERRLDRAVLDDVRQIRVIHGHGTAALKKAVRIYLKRSPYVEKFRPEPQELGGDGATRVILKGE